MLIPVLALSFLVSMGVMGIVGVLIERFAYRRCATRRAWRP